MNKFLLLFSPLLILVGCSGIPSDDVASEINYHFSENQTACAFIFYDVEDAPPLTMEDRVIDYHFNDQNIITTSSSVDFGWKSEENSGSHDKNFYKADGSEIGQNNLPVFNGGYTLNDTEYNFQVIHFNDQEECFAPDSVENDSLFKELIQEIYNLNS